MPSWRPIGKRRCTACGARATSSTCANLGLIAGIELEPRPGAPGKRAYEAFRRAFDAGLMIRVTGDIIALSPPLIVDKPDIDRMFETLREILQGLD